MDIPEKEPPIPFVDINTRREPDEDDYTATYGDLLGNDYVTQEYLQELINNYDEVAKVHIVDVDESVTQEKNINSVLINTHEDRWIGAIFFAEYRAWGITYRGENKDYIKQLHKAFTGGYEIGEYVGEEDSDPVNYPNPLLPEEQQVDREFEPMDDDVKMVEDVEEEKPEPQAE